MIQRPPLPNNNSPIITRDNECLVREQDRLMPIANVIRIMRRILPPHAKISDDAKETVQECVSEYISFVTGEANDRCQREQRKTITAEDILWAMSKLGFDDYIEPLTIYLHRYREIYGGERGSLSVKGTEPQANLFGIDVFQMGHRLFDHTTLAGLVKDPPN
uniref:nuclear transcription factor Y subunit B-6-like n=1 Tax=Erigeron canadensis TaxID=72917 RepID=UPI001CB90F36|nr:nuclear transcription factor Y subunit B-6-like [Erigeron canadensis]